MGNYPLCVNGKLPTICQSEMTHYMSMWNYTLYVNEKLFTMCHWKNVSVYLYGKLRTICQWESYPLYVNRKLRTICQWGTTDYIPVRNYTLYFPRSNDNSLIIKVIYGETCSTTSWKGMSFKKELWEGFQWWSHENISPSYSSVADYRRILVQTDLIFSRILKSLLFARFTGTDASRK